MVLYSGAASILLGGPGVGQHTKAAAARVVKGGEQEMDAKLAEAKGSNQNMNTLAANPLSLGGLVKASALGNTQGC
jgi:hypothetical protein